MTRLISIKAVSELPEAFKDKVSFQVVDNNVEAVTFTVGEETLRIVTNGTYSNHLKILAQQPKKEVTKYKLSGIVGVLRCNLRCLILNTKLTRNVRVMNTSLTSVKSS